MIVSLFLSKSLLPGVQEKMKKFGGRSPPLGLTSSGQKGLTIRTTYLPDVAIVIFLIISNLGQQETLIRDDNINAPACQFPA